MIVDFHTHVFPDKIAQKTISLLAAKADVPAFSDGTVDGLLARMDEAEIDVSVLLPVLTNPSRFESVNRFASEINQRFESASRRLISFAGIHPECESIDEKMAFIKNCGFRGVKIHPDYQGKYITDEGYIRILQCAKELDLVVVTHAGVDGAFKDTVRCAPELALEVIRKVQHPKFVLAHLGGNEMTDDVLEYLCEEDVYFDTSYVLRFVGEEKFKAVLKKHGADRILFATDCPWSLPKGDVEIIRSFGLDKNTENKIFFENALSLLGL